MTGVTPHFNNAGGQHPEPDFDDMQKLSVAAHEGNVAFMRDFREMFGQDALHLPRGGPGEYNAFLWAAKAGTVASLDYLYQQGADINIRDKSQDSPLLIAAWMGRKDAVEFLLRHGADYEVQDQHGFSPARRARENGHHDIADIIERFVVSDVSARIGQGAAKDLDMPVTTFRRLAR